MLIIIMQLLLGGFIHRFSHSSAAIHNLSRLKNWRRLSRPWAYRRHKVGVTLTCTILPSQTNKKELGIKLLRCDSFLAQLANKNSEPGRAEPGRCGRNFIRLFHLNELFDSMGKICFFFFECFVKSRGRVITQRRKLLEVLKCDFSSQMFPFPWPER